MAQRRGPSAECQSAAGGRPALGAAVVARDAKGWLFVGPFLAVFALTFLAPIGYAVYLSLFREQAFFGGSVFVGLDNYADVLTDDKFWEASLRVAAVLRHPGADHARSWPCWPRSRSTAPGSTARASSGW